MFPHRNIDGKAKYKIYEYKYFLAASKKFPKFGTQGSLAMRKREVSKELHLTFLVSVTQSVRLLKCGTKGQ